MLVQNNCINLAEVCSEFSVGIGQKSGHFFESAREMALVVKPALVSYLRQRNGRIFNQPQRFFNFQLPHIFAERTGKILREKL